MTVPTTCCRNRRSHASIQGVPRPAEQAVADRNFVSPRLLHRWPCSCCDLRVAYGIRFIRNASRTGRWRALTRYSTTPSPESTGSTGLIGPLSIPYFATLIILSVYGLHRYEVIRRYMKVKKKQRTEPPRISNSCRRLLSNCRSTTSDMSWSGCSKKSARWIIRKSCCRSRCWTIPPTKPMRSPSDW